MPRLTRLRSTPPRIRALARRHQALPILTRTPRTPLSRRPPRRIQNEGPFEQSRALPTSPHPTHRRHQPPRKAARPTSCNAPTMASTSSRSVHRTAYQSSARIYPPVLKAMPREMERRWLWATTHMLRHRHLSPHRLRSPI